jgi:hypothetical protein
MTEITTKQQLQALFATHEFTDHLSDFLDKIEEIYHPKIKSLEEAKNEFIEELRPYIEIYGKDMCNSFGKYWLEKGKGKRKMRFQYEKTFDIKLRLSRWQKNHEKFSIVNMLNKGK